MTARLLSGQPTLLPVADSATSVCREAASATESMAQSHCGRAGSKVERMICGAVISGFNEFHGATHRRGDTWLFESKLIPFCKPATAATSSRRRQDQRDPRSSKRAQSPANTGDYRPRTFEKPPAPGARVERSAKCRARRAVGGMHFCAFAFIIICAPQTESPTCAR